MNESITDLIGKIAPGVVSALLATLLAVRLAFSRYKREALWERKLEASTKILEALHVSRLNSEHEYEEALTGEGRSEEYKVVLKKKAADAWSELQKVYDVGSLIISEEAAIYLKTKLKPRYEAWKNDAPFEFWEEEEKIAREAIDHIKLLARRDLER